MRCCHICHKHKPQEEFSFIDGVAPFIKDIGADPMWERIRIAVCSDCDFTKDKKDRPPLAPEKSYRQQFLDRQEAQE